MVERSIRILLVEDNPADARLMREELREVGDFAFELRHVERLSEALDCLSAGSFDVVLLDLSLPDSAGLETLTRLEAAFSAVPILVLTGLNDEGVAIQAVQSGAEDYLVKGQLAGNVLARSIRYAIERKRAAEHLRESEIRFRKLAEATFEGICITDEDRIVEVNPSFAQMFGYPEHVLIGSTPLDLVTPEYREIVDRNIRTGSERPYEVTGRRADGSTFPIEVIGRALPYGGRTAHVSAIRDLTDRKRAEEERLRLVREQTARAEAEASQRWAAFLAETSSILSSSLDYDLTLAQVARLAVPYLADYCITYVSEGAETLRRVEIAHANPEHEDILRTVQERYPPRFREGSPLGDVLDRKRPILITEFSDALLESLAEDADHLRILRTLVPRSAIILPLTARDRTLGAIAFVTASSGRGYTGRDVTQLEGLADRVALALDNARLYRQAQEAVRTRNELFSAVSHDLKNPLGGIKAAAQLLQRRLRQVSLPEGDRMIDNVRTINSLSDKMTKLIDELLDLARLQIGESLDLERLPTDLVALAEQIAEEQQRATERHQIVVRRSVPHLVGEWDAARLERVLSNLLNNAVKYSPQGGEITITIAREEQAHGDQAVVEVQDAGIGIPAAELPRVFDRFYRASNAAERIRGAGIGLAGALQIVEQHGGTIGVTSEEGHGTIFTLRLPLAVTPAATSGERS